MSEQTRQRVAALAKATGRQMQQVIDDAVAAYERELFFTELDNGYAALAADEDAWAEVQAERVGEANALADEPPFDR